jgi:hypothetical protein
MMAGIERIRRFIGVGMPPAGLESETFTDHRESKSPDRQKGDLMRTMMNGALFSAALLGAGAAYAQQSVVWDVNSPQTIIAGTGCQKDVDAFASANGNDLAVVFTRLGVDLPGGASRTLADRKNCSVRVPAAIAPGVYIGTLTQRISYGVIKTAKSSGSLATRSSFFGFGVSPHTVNLPFGYAANQPLLTNQRVDQFYVHTQPDWVRGWCSPSRAPRGFYQANIAVQGQKSTAQEDLIMFVDGLDLKYEVGAALVRCQL